MSTTQSVRPGWPFWAVSLASLLWNGFGAFDFSMTMIRDADYLAQFPPEMMPVIDAFPAWTILAWACGVWGALAGSLLLLARSRLAMLAFALSLTGLAVSTGYQMSIDMPASLTTPAMRAMTAAIWAGALFLLWFARGQRRAGVLR